MLAHLVDVLAQVPIPATVVLILRPILKFVTHAIDDNNRWRRLMVLVVPLLIVAMALAGVAFWWLLEDGGLQVLLHDFGPASITQHPGAPH